MNQIQPPLSPSSPSPTANNAPLGENWSFEGVATDVRVLLKLIHDHKGGKRENDERKYERVSGMISIIDEVKSRIETIQSSKKVAHELRRCNTELKPRVKVPRAKKPAGDLGVIVEDEKEKLRRELSASIVAHRSLQAMCSGLGKEKQIMASQLARKAQELTEMEEFIADLKAQNDMLLEKMKTSDSLSPPPSMANNSRQVQITQALQERNTLLSEQLVKSVDGYRDLNKQMKEKVEDNLNIHATMEEMQAQVQAGINRIIAFNEQNVPKTEDDNNHKEEEGIITESMKQDISAIQHMLQSLNLKISKHCQKKSSRWVRSAEAIIRSRRFK